MRAIWIWVASSGLIVSGCAGTAAAQTTPESRPDPVASSVHPFTVARGSALSATVRGRGLRGATAAFLIDAPLRITVEGVEAEPPGQASGRGRTPMDLVRLRVEAPAESTPGRYLFRLITANGVSNALPLYITAEAVIAEPAGPHATPESAVPVSTVPVIYNGHLSRRGESDYYRFDAKAGQTLTFAVISGLPQIAAAGSAAGVANFDPSLSIYEASGSWFDARRLKRIAFHDEPVWVFGKSTDAHLVHRFERDGSYLARIEAFAGQGGPDYGYQFKVLAGAVPQDLPAKEETWEERTFTRPLLADRLNQLASRGGSKRGQPSIETYRAAPVDAAEAPMLKLPATLDGTLTSKGETHRARFQLDGPRDIVLEVEAAGTAPPFFNPVVRLLNGAGEEVATNILAGKGACSGALTKSLQAKVAVPLREAGTYTVEVRDLIAETPGSSFRYRVQVRPQVPHIGLVRLGIDHVNLAPEEAKTIRVVFDREEDYRGEIVVSAEALPDGVQAIAGADFEPDVDAREAIGKRDRYTARTERTLLVLAAAPDAPATPEPRLVRIVVRPLTGGKIGAPLATKSIPVMVTAKP